MGDIQISIKTIKGEVHSLDIDAESTVEVLRIFVEDLLQLDETDSLRLICRGKILEDAEKQLSDYGVA
ncbi:MAG: hypothetical protein MHM6MM_006879, partial [Cercozoa sp. M6MM]